MKKHTFYEVRERFANDEDGFYEYLERHRFESPSLIVGYYAEKMKRELYISVSVMSENAGFSRQTVNQVMAGRTSLKPDSYRRLAEVVGCNPLEFFVAEGWVTLGEVQAFNAQASDQLLLLELTRRLNKFTDDNAKRTAVQFVLNSLSTFVDLQN